MPMSVQPQSVFSADQVTTAVGWVKNGGFVQLKVSTDVVAPKSAPGATAVFRATSDPAPGTLILNDQGGTVQTGGPLNIVTTTSAGVPLTLTDAGTPGLHNVVAIANANGKSFTLDVDPVGSNNYRIVTAGGLNIFAGGGASSGGWQSATSLSGTTQILGLGVGAPGPGQFANIQLGTAGFVGIETRAQQGVGMTNCWIYEPLAGSQAASGTFTIRGTSNLAAGNLILNDLGGNVGIGTSGPAATLHVVGSDLFAEGAGLVRRGNGAVVEIQITTGGLKLSVNDGGAPNSDTYIALGHGGSGGGTFNTGFIENAMSFGGARKGIDLGLSANAGGSLIQTLSGFTLNDLPFVVAPFGAGAAGYIAMFSSGNFGGYVVSSGGTLANVSQLFIGNVAGTFSVGVEKTGTGTYSDLAFRASGANAWLLKTTGVLQGVGGGTVQGGAGANTLTLSGGAGAASSVLIQGAGTDKIGFYGAAAVVRPTVTGSRGGNAALASALSGLASLGLIVDGSAP